jgi:hypothetical protein
LETHPDHANAAVRTLHSWEPNAAIEKVAFSLVNK